MTQSDVVDHDDAEMQTRLDDQQEVGIDVEIAEEDDRLSVHEVIDEAEYSEGEDDEFECCADQVHVTDRQTHTQTERERKIEGERERYMLQMTDTDSAAQSTED